MVFSSFVLLCCIAQKGYAAFLRTVTAQTEFQFLRLSTPANELYLKICANLDKSVKIIDKIVNYEAGDTYMVRVLVVAEENIAFPEKISEQKNQEDQQEQKQ